MLLFGRLFVGGLYSNHRNKLFIIKKNTQFVLPSSDDDSSRIDNAMLLLSSFK